MPLRREKQTIIIEMLEEAKEPKKITHLMYRSNQNQICCKRYTNALLQAGFFENVGNASRPEYRTTLKGIEWLNNLKKSSEGLKEFNKYW